MLRYLRKEKQQTRLSGHWSVASADFSSAASSSWSSASGGVVACLHGIWEVELYRAVCSQLAAGKKEKAERNSFVSTREQVLCAWTGEGTGQWHSAEAVSREPRPDLLRVPGFQLDWAARLQDEAAASVSVL